VHRPEGRAAPGAGSPGDGPAACRSGDPGFRVDAVVLAGGRASRLGGADKPALVVGDRSLLASVTSAADAAGARQVVVVGPPRPGLVLAGGRLRVVREDPPGSGPVPALRRGLAEVAAPWVLVLAADLPFIRAGHLSTLLAAATGARPAAGAVLADDDGRPQWLAGCWPTEALRAASRGYRGRSLRGLLAPLSPVMLGPAPGQPGPPPWLDCDTEDDVRRARAWSGDPAGPGPGVR
jgi:molybdopterin-guanine dinucleotide biosynthesis protein A